MSCAVFVSKDSTVRPSLNKKSNSSPKNAKRIEFWSWDRNYRAVTIIHLNKIDM